MPKAKPVSRSDVERRSKEPQEELQVCELALINKLVRRAGVTDQAETAKFKESLDCTIREYRLRVLVAEKQERPAQIVAALKPGVKAAKELLSWLDSLPVSVLIELQAGGVKEFCERVINREAYWQGHVNAHRPAGEGDASLALRRTLTAIITAHRPDPPNATAEQKRFKEQRLRDWVAFACREIGAKYPHHKKHRRRFIGEHEPSAGAWSADVYTTLPDELRFVALGLPLVASEGEDRLKGVPI